MSNKGKIQKAKDRYVAAAHAMQSGVTMAATRGLLTDRQGNKIDKSATSKHLRVGVNVAMVDHGALATLLQEKGIITELEYLNSLADMMEMEVKKYEAILSEDLGGVAIHLH